MADNSREISYLIFFRKLGKMLQNLSSDAVVIVALRVKEDKNKKYENESYFKIHIGKLLIPLNSS